GFFIFINQQVIAIFEITTSTIMKNVFNTVDVEEMIGRINKLTPQTQPLWGKMTVGQMLAHCNVSYEMAYEDKHPKPNPFARLLIKAFVKNTVVGPKPY